MQNEILDAIVIPRRCGSDEFFEVAAFIRNWLENRGLIVKSHIFSLAPYIFEIVGTVIIVLSVIFTYLAVKNKSIAALGLPLILVIIVYCELVADIAFIRGVYQIEAENIIASIHPLEMMTCSLKDEITMDRTLGSSPLDPVVSSERVR